MQVASTSSPGRCHQLPAEKISTSLSSRASIKRREDHVVDVVMSYLARGAPKFCTQ
jgi:hypothetical protein